MRRDPGMSEVAPSVEGQQENEGEQRPGSPLRSPSSIVPALAKGLPEVHEEEGADAAVIGKGVEGGVPQSPLLNPRESLTEAGGGAAKVGVSCDLLVL